jgi:hypothetical protein
LLTALDWFSFEQNIQTMEMREIEKHKQNEMNGDGRTRVGNMEAEGVGEPK